MQAGVEAQDTIIKVMAAVVEQAMAGQTPQLLAPQPPPTRGLAVAAVARKRTLATLVALVPS